MPESAPLSGRPDLADWLAEVVPEAVVFHGFDDAILGVVERFGAEPVILYDRTKCLEALMEQGMTDMEAVEYFEYNVAGCWAGDGTPAFAEMWCGDEPAGDRLAGPQTD